MTKFYLIIEETKINTEFNKMKGNLKGFVDFGIAPTTTYAAAGYDFYVPNLTTPIQKANALKAFEKSYNKTADELNEICDKLALYTTAVSVANVEAINDNIENMLLLFLALESADIEAKETLDDKIDVFVSNYLVFDTNKNVPGIVAKLNDHIKINSGVKVALDQETAGIFYNKSGMGTRGWDVRACVVDEDYSGYVHLSGAYTKNDPKKGTFYCGDKFSQMVIEMIVRGEQFENLGQEKYDELMKDSQRGANAMGSSDIKH